MIKNWQLQEAKNKFSQVVRDAAGGHPQIITKHGTEVAIVLAYHEYRALLASRPKLSTFFQQSPLAEIDLDLTRDTSPGRDEFSL